MITSDRWTTLMHSLCKYGTTISSKSMEIIHWFNTNNVIYNTKVNLKKNNYVNSGIQTDWHTFNP